MPLDASPQVEVIPDLSKPSLRGLAWLLRRQDHWKEWFVCDFMNSWTIRYDQRGHYCGTAGCAIGLAQETWPDVSRVEYHLGLPEKYVKAIFYDQALDLQCGLPTRRHKFYSVPMWRVTPLMVADMIDRYLGDHPDAQ